MMKKLIALLAVSTLVLSGCTWFQPAEEPEVIDEAMVVEDLHENDSMMMEDGKEEMAIFENTVMGVQFEYPKSIHMDTSFNEPGANYIYFGEEYMKQGGLKSFIHIMFEREDYLELNKDLELPLFSLENACENEDQQEFIKDCEELSNGMTSYLLVSHMGDIGFGKYYYIERENSKWAKIQIRVDLWSSELSDEFADIGYDGIDEYLLERELDEEQLKRIELADKIVNSMKLK